MIHIEIDIYNSFSAANELREYLKKNRHERLSFRDNVVFNALLNDRYKVIITSEELLSVVNNGYFQDFVNSFMDKSKTTRIHMVYKNLSGDFIDIPYDSKIFSILRVMQIMLMCHKNTFNVDVNYKDAHASTEIFNVVKLENGKYLAVNKKGNVECTENPWDPKYLVAPTNTRPNTKKEEYLYKDYQRFNKAMTDTVLRFYRAFRDVVENTDWSKDQKIEVAEVIENKIKELCKEYKNGLKLFYPDSDFRDYTQQRKIEYRKWKIGFIVQEKDMEEYLYGDKKKDNKEKDKKKDNKKKDDKKKRDKKDKKGKKDKNDKKHHSKSDKKEKDKKKDNKKKDDKKKKDNNKKK